jgi:hypothetical protein
MTKGFALDFFDLRFSVVLFFCGVRTHELKP